MTETYLPASNRYDGMTYRRCGKSGIDLPAVSLGLWNNFGFDFSFQNSRAMVRRAFDLGITHIDLANNYGPPAGAAEENFGTMMRKDFRPYRDEMIISTKAGYGMWPGPYGNWGSRKYLLASLDQSLKRMDLDYVDIFYSHRFDPNTPLEETMSALASAVEYGKALYVGVSSYSAQKTAEACEILRRMGVRPLIHQPSYSMLNRWIEDDLLEEVERQGLGVIAFSPLAQGLLTGKYLGGTPEDSRAVKQEQFFKKASYLTEENLERVRALGEIAKYRGQSLAQMALAWCLRDPRVTSVLIGASKVAQIEENVGALEKLDFSNEELQKIEPHAQEGGVNMWAASSNAG